MCLHWTEYSDDSLGPPDADEQQESVSLSHGSVSTNRLRQGKSSSTYQQTGGLGDYTDDEDEKSGSGHSSADDNKHHHRLTADDLEVSKPDGRRMDSPPFACNKPLCLELHGFACLVVVWLAQARCVCMLDHDHHRLTSAHFLPTNGEQVEEMDYFELKPDAKFKSYVSPKQRKKERQKKKERAAYYTEMKRLK